MLTKHFKGFLYYCIINRFSSIKLEYLHIIVPGFFLGPLILLKKKEKNIPKCQIKKYVPHHIYMIYLFHLSVSVATAKFPNKVYFFSK